MDLKNFKMLKDDATAYTLAHPSGKTITVPKKGLKPEAHEMIKKMCSGGQVQKLAFGGFGGVDTLAGMGPILSSMTGQNQAPAAPAQPQMHMGNQVNRPMGQSIIGEQAQPMQTAQPSAVAPAPVATQPAPAAPMINTMGVTAAPAAAPARTVGPGPAAAPGSHDMTKTFMAKGGQVQKFAGDDADPSASEVQPADDSAPAAMDTTPGPTVAMNTDTAPTTNNGPKGFADLPGSKFFSNLWENRPGNHTVFNRPEDVAARDAKAKADESAQTQEAPQDVPPPLAPVTTEDGQKVKVGKELTMQQAYQNEKQANRDFANAVGGEGTAEAQAIQANQDQIAKMPTIQDIVDANRQKNQQLMDAYNDQKIDPNRYLHNLSTAGKITTALGLFLGGVSTPYTHQGNPALAMLNNAISNDIDAQKNDQNRAHTLWSMNREALGTDLAANLATQNQMYTGLKYKLQSAAAQFKGPMAQANAKMLNSQIDQKIATNNQMLGLHAGLTGQAGDGTEQSFVKNLQTAQVYNPKMAEDASKTYLPGIGVTRIPVTDDDRKELNAYDSIKKNIDKARVLQNNFGKGGAWTPQNRAEAESIKGELKLSMGDLTGIKRTSPELMKTYDDIIGGIGGMNLGGVPEKLKGISDWANMKRTTQLQSLGTTPFHKSAADLVAIKWAQQNLNGPQAAQAQRILQLHGGK